jgi:hypothetical protein
VPDSALSPFFIYTSLRSTPKRSKPATTGPQDGHQAAPNRAERGKMHDATTTRWDESSRPNGHHIDQEAH